MLYLAIRFYKKGLYETNQPVKPGSRRRIKMAGYQISKEAYHVLKVVLPDLMGDIPRSRIATYQYITLGEASERWQALKSYFLISIEAQTLSRIEQTTKATSNPPVYLWRENQWLTFPQLELYNTGEKTTITTTIGAIFGNVQETRTSETDKMAWRIRETYEPVPAGNSIFELVPPSTSGIRQISAGAANPAGFPTSITGNGMVLEWKRGYEDKQECWWLHDEQRVSKAQSATYQHYHVLKATSHARWSKSFSSWYYTGGVTPPQAWLDLVGYNSTLTMPPELSAQIENVLAQEQVPPPRTFEDKRLSFLETMRQKRELEAIMQPYQQFQAVHKVMQQASETLHHLTYCKLLPAIATPPLNDPWS